MKKQIKGRLLACLILLFLINTAFANDFQQEFRSRLHDYLYNDRLFYRIEETKKESEERVNTICHSIRELPHLQHPGSSGFVAQQVCIDTLKGTYPGSIYNPFTGGYVVLGNTIVYLTAIPAKATKIVLQENFLITAVPNPYFPGSYTVSVKVPEGGSAQFMLTKDGIIDIQSISSVYDIEKAFLNQNKKISRKSLVTEMLGYYKALKQFKNVSSIDFILAMLTSIEAQENFIEYVLQKQGGKK